MKFGGKIKYITTVFLIVSLLCSPGSLLITEAADGYQNNTGLYNCYAYAINRIIIGDKFYHINSNAPTYQPGDISKDYRNIIFGRPYTIDKIKCNTLRDLYAMGYTDVLIYSNVEDYNAYNSMLADIDFSTQELICLRVGTTDYHFMRYDSATNAWYNKNGYDPIYKYTNNNGIPSNDVPWVSGSNVYDSEIIYLVYNKLQISIPENGELEQNITVKGGVDEGLNYNPIYCCGDDACCNPDGVCSCENEIVYGGKDALYEIVVPESGCYTIQITTPTVTYNETSIANFNYEIYSYNMYNGDYDVLKSGSGQSGSTFTETVNLTAYDDYNDGTTDWQYQAYKHYIRLDFGRVNTTDQSVTVNITHQHTYTDHYGQTTDFSHEAYCWCGEHISQSHSLEYYMHNGLQHKVACYCGYTYYEPHVYATSAQVKICLRCGQMAGSGGILLEAPGEIIYLTESGSYLRPDGIVMLSDVDVELYLAGELDINALIRQATNPAA